MSSVKVEVKRKKQTYSFEELSELQKNELIDIIVKLEAHNKQLKSIIAKQTSTSERKDENESRKRNRPFDFSRFPKQHIAMKLLYLGWNYQGFASIEDSTSTIEHHIFAALQKSCLIENRESAGYNRCGRTDKRVSAFEQVISLTVRASKDGDPPLDYCKILNRLLPKDIRVIAWKPVPDGFSARFDCKKRTYRYFFPQGDLDLKAMQKGADYLLGTHDFRNLCKMDVANGVTSFERTVETAHVRLLSTTSTLNDSGFNMCEFRISSKGFLWHQVRCLMGVLVLIGRRLEEPEVIISLLDINTFPRKPQYSLAIGDPLCLFYCEFDESKFDWVIDENSLSEVIQTLQQEWMLHSIKGTMISEMLLDLGTLSSAKLNMQSSGLLQGTKSKVYVPLLERPTCESLEDRVAHYVEKKRLEITSEGSSTNIKM